MCGIVAYIGKKNVYNILIEGLKRLEYRGYDSAGIAVLYDDKLEIYKEKGKIQNLENSINGSLRKSNIGIAHTRWATHGEPSKLNAHPHTSLDNTVAVVHNGIIENYNYLKEKLSKIGIKCKTEVDTEVLAHLIRINMNKCSSLVEAVRNTLLEIEGTYGLCVISSDEPDKIIGARKGSPLVIGIGEDEYFLASDVTAIVQYTRKVIYLDDGEMAIITRDEFITKTIDNRDVKKVITDIPWDIERVQKSGFDHYMLKEIYEQPQTILDAMRGRIIESTSTIKLGGLQDYEDLLLKSRRFIFVACGTSWHAALVGEYLLEELVGIPVEVEYASEFRYRNPVIEDGTAVFAISQSGETADTLAALREAKNRNIPVFGITNVVGSTIARETDAGIYIHAGPEIGVASTKAFTSQLTVLVLLTLYLGRRKNISAEKGRKIIDALKKIPEQVEIILKQHEHIKKCAENYKTATNFLYLARGIQFPIALEGALKLKEISYIHAEGYPAAEMKHGPIALIDENMPVVVIAPSDSLYEKMLSNINEIKARKGRIIAITNPDDEWITKTADNLIEVPKTLNFLSPLLTIIPLQLLAYEIAVKRGCSVDQPRNLAKSVTVE